MVWFHKRKSPGKTRAEPVAQPLDRPGVPRRIIGYHQDDESHWVAELECGHAQHVRHEPPLITRPWVTTEAGRIEHLGTTLACTLCVPNEA